MLCDKLMNYRSFFLLYFRALSNLQYETSIILVFLVENPNVSMFIDINEQIILIIKLAYVTQRNVGIYKLKGKSIKRIL